VETVILPIASACIFMLMHMEDSRLDVLHGAMARPPVRIVLVLEMLAVAIRRGASISHALERVSMAIDDDLGWAIGRVVCRLHRGIAWTPAWAPVCDGNACGVCCTVLRDSLEASWRLGASPLPRIEAVVQQLDSAERNRIESEAAHLSVKLLLPTALCFLPAFVLIGVIPCIAAFAQGMFA
jgi:hypothetical protein